MSALVLRSKASNGYDEAFMAACVDELRVTPERLDQVHFLVAEEGEALLGCAGLRPTNEGGEVTSFFIEPSAKRKGIGRGLWAALLETARKAGMARLALDADPEAVPFYEAMGFEVTGKVPSGSIPGRFLPRMEMGLT
jgi:N-acetylglutamate synthase-like GNAT family acetyltransferase